MSTLGSATPMQRLRLFWTNTGLSRLFRGPGIVRRRSMAGVRRRTLIRWIDGGLHVLFLVVIALVVLRSQGCAGSRPTVRLSTLQGAANQGNMDRSQNRVTYKGFRSGDGWEVAVSRPGQPLRLLDRPANGEDWSLSILLDYLGERNRALSLYLDFASLTINRFTEDWELSGSDIEQAFLEVEVLRARWRMALMRG
jgi:hypothetical protein